MRKLITVAASAALLVTAVTPAAAGHRRHRDHDDVDAGDVIGAAVVVGGIAAIASAFNDGGRIKKDAAVGACSQEAESRTGGRVAAILNVAKRKGYYTVEGAVDGDMGEPSHSFTCTIRNGSIYSFRAEPDEI